MWFIYILSWIAMIIQICFATLAIAAGLFYLAELVEEYTVLSAKIIRYILWGTTLTLFGLLVFENMPWSLIGGCIVSNVTYYFEMKTFPFIQLTSPVFIASVVLLVMNHYFAFSYFASVWHPFSEVLAFFTICLWLVPFALFVSLSANENTLPTSFEQQISASVNADSESDVVTNYFLRKNKRYGLLSFLKSAQYTILPQRVKKSLLKLIKLKLYYIFCIYINR